MKTALNFNDAWDSLMQELYSLVYKNREIGEEFDEYEDQEYVETSFRLVRHFRHPLAEMGIELTFNGIDARITVFVLDPERRGLESRSVSILETFHVSYDELLESPQEAKHRVFLSLH